MRNKFDIDVQINHNGLIMFDSLFTLTQTKWWIKYLMHCWYFTFVHNLPLLFFWCCCGWTSHRSYCEREFRDCRLQTCYVQSPAYPGLYPRALNCRYRLHTRQPFIKLYLQNEHFSVDGQRYVHISFYNLFFILLLILCITVFPSTFRYMFDAWHLINLLINKYLNRDVSTSFVCDDGCVRFGVCLCWCAHRTMWYNLFNLLVSIKAATAQTEARKMDTSKRDRPTAEIFSSVNMHALGNHTRENIHAIRVYTSCCNCWRAAASAAVAVMGGRRQWAYCLSTFIMSICVFRCRS